MMSKKIQLVALLRGINVGGKHKISMESLCQEFNHLGFENVKTLLNSGNVLLEAEEINLENLETKIELHLSNIFEFQISVILLQKSELLDFVCQKPFQEVVINDEIQLYLSFLKDKPIISLELPYIVENGGFEIKILHNKMIGSIVNLSKTQTTKAMKHLEKLFGKDITTRNWNTILRMIEN